MLVGLYGTVYTSSSKEQYYFICGDALIVIGRVKQLRIERNIVTTMVDIYINVLMKENNGEYYIALHFGHDA